MSKNFKLPCGRLFLIDDADVHLLDGRNWYSGKSAGKYYVRGRKPGERIYGLALHRLILGLKAGEICDFKNGRGLDCRRSNLRKCTQAQNTMNCGKKRTYKKFKGAFFDRRKGLWYAQIAITKDGRRHRYFGGLFNTDKEAARAYDKLAIEHHGEFANLNFA